LVGCAALEAIDIGAGWKLDERFELRFLIKYLLDKV
jgi:hypothetical protein